MTNLAWLFRISSYWFGFLELFRQKAEKFMIIAAVSNDINFKSEQHAQWKLLSGHLVVGLSMIVDKNRKYTSSVIH